MRKLTSVVELSSFIADTEGELNDDERESLKVFLAANPDMGVVIKGTGGVRKLRWAASGRGKRGGGRVFITTIATKYPSTCSNSSRRLERPI
ncbi:MAG: hypothetical protein ACT4OF_04925 [Caulobacteraceae bacterium]